MRTHLWQRTVLASVLGLALVTMSQAEAKSPIPTEAEGVVLAIDHDKHTLEFKPTRSEKPFVLDWDKRTNFVKDGRDATPDALKAGTSVTIYYKRLSSRQPILKRAVWWERADGQ